jgi:ABC-type molybdate transport system substrate-binding protein
LPAVGGAIGTLIQNAGQKKQQQREFENNKEMWNASNYYNSPEQQMQRLKDAGLNPNLVYGNGSVVGNSSSPAPRYNAPNLQRLPLEMFNPMAVLGQYLDLKQKSASIDLTNQNIKNSTIENKFKEMQKEAELEKLFQYVNKGRLDTGLSYETWKDGRSIPTGSLKDSRYKLMQDEIYNSLVNENTLKNSKLGLYNKQLEREDTQRQDLCPMRKMCILS